jgi:hypothetical protein
VVGCPEAHRSFGRHQKSHPLRVAVVGRRRWQPRRGANRQARSPPFSRRVWNVIDHGRAFGLINFGFWILDFGLPRQSQRHRAFGPSVLAGPIQNPKSKIQNRNTVAGLRRTCTGLPHDISAAPRQRGPVIMQNETGRCAARATSRPAPDQAEAASGSRCGRRFPPLNGEAGFRSPGMRRARALHSRVDRQ